MEITVLCRVVDNYGDIGFVYRLARSIREISRGIRLSLIVSDLEAFARIADIRISAGKKYQRRGGWRIFDWNAAEECGRYFMRHEPLYIVECFQCGRPDWLDGILFRKDKKSVTHMLNLEYLTAETWADEFHLLKSGTRSPLVRKVNFMPGFTRRTAGLVLDAHFTKCVRNRKLAMADVAPLLPPDASRALSDPGIFCVTVFSYERDFTCVAEALSKKGNAHVLLAEGPGKDCFLSAMRESKSAFPVTVLPPLPQTAWDALLCCSDFNFIRGEDSFSRACLSGIPFIWHAYRQSEGTHLIKVSALLNVMENFFAEKEDAEFFRLYRKTMLWYNTRDGDADGICAEAAECMREAEAPTPEALLSVISHGGCDGPFRDFSDYLFSNGNLTESLIAYFRNLQDK